MSARIRKAMEKRERGEGGFTLIELLVVVIIIGILAAIAIPVFLNQRKSAVDAGIKSDLRTIANEVETYFVNHQVYPADDEVTGGTAAGSDDPIVVGTGGNQVFKSHINDVYDYDLNDTGDAYTITGVNATEGTNTVYTYDSAQGGLLTETEAGD